MSDRFEFYKQFLSDLIRESGKNPDWNGKGNFRCILPGHEDNTPSASIKDERYRCFTCQFSGDTIDLLQAINRVDRIAALEIAEQKWGRAPGDFPGKTATIKKADSGDSGEFKEHKNTRARERNGEDSAVFAGPIKKATDADDLYFQKCHDALDAWMDSTGGVHRGLSLSTLKAFPVGYDPQCRIGGGPYRGVVFFSDDKLTKSARNIEAKEKKDRYRKDKNASAFLFNASEFDKEDKRPIFITEGEYDALSFLEIGKRAIGLGGSAGKNSLVETIKEKRWKGNLVLALDNDKSGEDARIGLINALQNIPGVEFLSFDWSDAFTTSLEENKAIKDPNEYLQENRAVFEKAAQDREEAFARIYNEKYNAAVVLDSFLHDAYKTSVFPTEFPFLNAGLGGGFFEGLIVLGGIAGKGKTAFALQLANHYARQGKDALFFCLEMGKREMVSRALSTETFKTLCRRYAELDPVIKQERSVNEALSHSEICLQARVDRGQGTLVPFTDADIGLLREAVSDYRSVAEHLYFIDAAFAINHYDICNAVQKHIDKTGNIPIVFVDYLQVIMPPAGEKVFSERQIVDNSLKAFKILSRDLRTPVFVVSSLNRDASKRTESDGLVRTDFKESGGIEYTADVLIGLSTYIDNHTPPEKKEDAIGWREGLYDVIRLDVIKNRNGIPGRSLTLNFYNKVGRFTPSAARIKSK